MRRKESNILLTLLVIIFLLLSGCAATVPVMPDSMDASAKQFSPPSGKANIYITRTSTLGFAVLFKVHLNGRLVGTIATDTYLLFEVEPKRHQVAVITQESQDALDIRAEAGKNYFIDVEPKWGWMYARAALNSLTEVEGKAAVKQAKRAKPLNIEQ